MRHKRTLLTIAGIYFLAMAVVAYDIHIADQLANTVRWSVVALSLPLGIFTLILFRHEPRVVYRGILSVFMVAWWQALVAFFALQDWPMARATMALWGTFGVFFLGLVWTVWVVERGTQRFARRSLETAKAKVQKSRQDSGWNPFDLQACYYALNWNPLSPNAWYYFRWVNRYRRPPACGRSAKLDQSLATIAAYAFLSCLTIVVLSTLQGCREIYEMPAGGGERKQIAQKVRIQKVVRKKYIVNPFSVIFFQIRDIDHVKLQLRKITKHAYTVGFGQGKGAGFAGGTNLGKVRFIRLQYNGGDWDQDYGVGADLNMLVEYGLRTRHKVEKRTESRRILQLRNFPVGKSPPMVYMTGQSGISVTNKEVKVLREYLLDKHGMIFCDNGGSRQFHYAFTSLMSRVLPNVRPVPIPLDDQIHRTPYEIPFLPYVSPHGGKDALGWYKDGRWVCYYHPGDINDAWCDDHAGVSAEVWEACYQLGTNVIFYAHAEYSKWLTAQKNAKRQ